MALTSSKISIIMTVFKVMTYIEEAIDSVLQQSFNNFELLIIDDGSPPEAVAYLEQLLQIKNDPRIRLFKIAHAGRAQALNYGLSQAMSEWIAILDADDVWHPLKLQLQLAAAESHQCVFLATKAIIFKNFQDITPYLAKKNFTSEVCLITLNKIMFNNPLGHSSVLYKIDNKSYNNKLKSQIDYDLYMSFLKNKERLYILNDQVTFLRMHPQRLFGGRKILKYRFNFFKLRLINAIELHKYSYIPLIVIHFLGSLIISYTARQKIQNLGKKFRSIEEL